VKPFNSSNLLAHII